MTTGRINQVALLRDERSSCATNKGRTRTTKRTRERSSRCDANRAHGSRARSFSDEQTLTCERTEERTKDARGTKSTNSIDRPARARPHSAARFATTLGRPPRRKGERRALNSRVNATNASTRGHHAVSHQTTRAPRILHYKGREHKPGVLTRESSRLAIHIVKPHNRFTHCPDRRRVV
jgi:hypothetical protein